MAATALAVLLSVLAAPGGYPCEALSGRSFTDAKVTSAGQVPAGSWKAPDGTELKRLPATCRVALRITPGTGSTILAEVWLPREGWNGRLLGTGNGGYGGVLSYEWLPAFVPEGYAVAIDDMGTTPATGAAPEARLDGSHLAGQPARWVDYGWRAAHATAVVAKEVVAAHYGKPAHHAYFDGCSAGGRQALMEAQRFPEDYDGIIAGCAGRLASRDVAQFAWMHRAVHASPGAALSAEKIEALRKAVLAACGPNDADPAGNRWLVDPSLCTFDPAAMRCKEADGPDCLTEAQVTAMRLLYAGPSSPRTGESLYPGLPRGAESAQFLPALAAMPQPPFDALFRWIFGTSWDPASLDLDRDLATVEAVLAPILNAGSADVSRFARRGGKLILWHGLADPILPAGSSTAYYRQLVAAEQGGIQATRRFARLFLVPGVAHCGGGPGADAFEAPFAGADADHDMLGALVRWVEQGVAPDRIVASKLVDPDDPAKGIAFERPLCPYPEVQRYRGTGDRAAAASFECAEPVGGSAPTPGGISR